MAVSFLEKNQIQYLLTGSDPSDSDSTAWVNVSEYEQLTFLCTVSAGTADELFNFEFNSAKDSSGTGSQRIACYEQYYKTRLGGGGTSNWQKSSFSGHSYQTNTNYTNAWRMCAFTFNLDRDQSRFQDHNFLQLEIENDGTSGVTADTVTVEVVAIASSPKYSGQPEELISIV